MPELPEVETSCRGIRPHLVGKSIDHIEVLNGQLRWPVSEEIHSLRQAQVHSVSRRSKYILIETGDGHMIIHLGMSGSLRVIDADEPLKKHDHLIFHLPDGKQMRYHDPRRFGCALWTHESPARHTLIRSLGPEPLSEAFTPEHLIQSCEGRQRTIKQHIMDGHVVVGVGNIYACEALHFSKINPKKPAAKVSKPKLRLLHQNIRKVLSNAIEQGGTTLRDFTKSDGQPGYFQQELYVYGREAEPCKVCDGTIKRVVLGQRSTFYCPRCQP
ncbi:bifunctional DNA-formamidopyrimidine glycosylase/DNA-(apurinic or apyrimidinic site) lyase [Rubritalea marina]|uniref:bifunctional DNA-formamidopyrimidine glycosylase/DNA-(apurinic or apyrimidinic site) lyase n=1 Tax=Rubritalea marina TaxID=361055 RepID=UPI000477C7A2|nr:bifunctional DNA-formamidopyrimidine glycosylase/DNA-(apurinic or apyrimidinic site) lyase [Rubritalea marina]